MKVTTEEKTVYSVEVRFTIDDLRECLRFTDENGDERELPRHAILSRVTPDPEHAPNIWELVATFDEEVEKSSKPKYKPRYPVVSELVKRKREAAVIAALSTNEGRFDGLTDDQIVEHAAKLGIGDFLTRQTRRQLTELGRIKSIGTCRELERETGPASGKIVYKLSEHVERP